jgi:hypothetical protein
MSKYGSNVIKENARLQANPKRKPDKLQKFEAL